MKRPLGTSAQTIIIELAGGLAILAGAFVPLISLPMAVILLVAALTVHLPYGFSSIKLQALTAAGAQSGQPGHGLPVPGVSGGARARRFGTVLGRRVARAGSQK